MSNAEIAIAVIGSGYLFLVVGFLLGYIVRGLIYITPDDEQG